RGWVYLPRCAAASRGRVTLASLDPQSPIRIFQNFLATDNDWATLRAGFRMLREIGAQAPLAAFTAAEIAPGPACRSDAEIDAHVRATAVTGQHRMGTCRMGSAADDMAVVDDELRVFGAEGLRVVDASVTPDLVGGNITPVIMIAEKAADLIRGGSSLAPVSV